MKINLSALNYSVILTIFLIVTLTLASEMSESFKSFLTQISGHHWLTKSFLSLIFLPFAYFLFKKAKAKDILRQTYLLAGTTVLSALVIFLFYLGQVLGK